MYDYEVNSLPLCNVSAKEDRKTEPRIIDGRFDPVVRSETPLSSVSVLSLSSGIRDLRTVFVDVDGTHNRWPDSSAHSATLRMVPRRCPRASAGAWYAILSLSYRKG